MFLFGSEFVVLQGCCLVWELGLSKITTLKLDPFHIQGQRHSLSVLLHHYFCTTPVTRICSFPFNLTSIHQLFCHLSQSFRDTIYSIHCVKHLITSFVFQWSPPLPDILCSLYHSTFPPTDTIFSHSGSMTASMLACCYQYRTTSPVPSFLHIFRHLT